MVAIVEALAEVSGGYEAVFCDLWGCLHDGQKAFPSAVAALRAYRARGGMVLLLTNSPRPRAAVVRQLDKMGVPRDAWDEVATSGDAAQLAMLNGVVGRKAFHIGAPKDESFFTDLAEDLAGFAEGQPPVERVGLDEAEGIICTGLRDDLTEVPEDYHPELRRALERGLPMLCANPDIVVDWGEKRLFCAGAIARDYQAMGGRALYFGKPHRPIYDLALKRLAVLRPGISRILCIGDGVSTDVKGGLDQGMDVLFVTGGLEAAEFGADSGHPDPALLAPWLEARGLTPRFAVGLLR